MDIKPQSANKQTGANTQKTQPVGNTGNAANPHTSFLHSGNVQGAFGWSSATDRASKFVELVNEEKKNNEALRAYGVERIDSLCGTHGSAVAIVAYYPATDRHIASAIYFENNDSMILSVDANQKETYESTISKVDETFSDAIINSLTAKGYSNVVYLTANIIPADVRVLTIEDAKAVMGQLIASTFGRGVGVLDKLVVDHTQVFNVNVTAFNADAVEDPNGLPQRADLGLRIQNTVKGKDNQGLVLVNDTSVRVEEILSSAYINARYSGFRQTATIQGQTEDLTQITPEVVVTLTSTGPCAPMERQLVTLGMWSKICAQGAWRGPFLDGLSNTRKISAVARHLNWKQDTSKIRMEDFDKNRDAQGLFLNKFCKPTAALVVSHRVGNGIGGLTSILAELLDNNKAIGALSDLVALLDSAFPEIKQGNNVVRNSFTTLLKQHLGVQSISASNFVVTAVPTIAGSYKGSNGPRSLDDMDFVTVCNYFGDKFNDVKNFAELSSFNARRVDPKDARIALMKYADEIYGANSPRFTGEALHIVINPDFADLLSSEISARCTYFLNGASTYIKEEKSLFCDNSGIDYTVSSVYGGTASNNDLGTTSIGGGSVWR